MKKFNRREFMFTSGLTVGALMLTSFKSSFDSSAGWFDHPAEISTPQPNEDVFAYISRVKGKFDLTLYRKVVGSANHFKEGDLAQGVAAFNENSRLNARTLLANTKILDLTKTPLFTDDIYTLIATSTDQNTFNSISNLTLGELKAFILEKPESEIKLIMPGLSSDIIAMLVKLMSNDELIIVGQKVFNPLPGSNLGAKGYLSARVQPNSPTDHPDDIMMQVFDAWSYAVGDLILGTNPVSSDPDSVAKVEFTLHDILKTFGLETVMPNCVLSHIDVQAEVEKLYPGTTGIWFQSLAGTVKANMTFDVTIDKMMNYASMRTGQYGLYGETGQGADFTNGHGEGFDMVVHESRKYGFMRALKKRIGEVQKKDLPGPWVHINDVAGFIGPEVFKTKDQLVRCCLEDTVMGKLHGLTIGLDICSTLHMDITLDDLAWCIDQVMPANPAYLMALPTKNDPMLSYLTTGFNDHVRVREKFGYKVNDAMWDFFKKIEIIGPDGTITSHFGDPLWVWYKYRLAKGDPGSKEEIYKEGNKLIAAIEERGVPIAVGYGQNSWDLEPELDKKIHALYEDSKACLWMEMTNAFIDSIPNHLYIETGSADRKDYIYHPPTGEQLSRKSVDQLIRLRKKWKGRSPDVQIIISDGLNVSALSDEGHLKPYLEYLNRELSSAGLIVSTNNIVVRHGRVRAGYRCGEFLFGEEIGTNKPKGIIHIIGERPGSGHHNFSAYLSAPLISTWKVKGKLDHNYSKVVSGISDTSLIPELAAKETIKLLTQLFNAAS
jgi:ethanolamine ammonia-lyase large subunit